ncbi:pre-mRNA processing ribonucleoprotein,-binding region [Thermocladium modestius]|uniref:Pre-mRNA processing ribonucleoprotein,-binding region n=1 Tax=Thermocladium modestius TaxID=62609 RepID=A0A830GR38_9CREN|nr:C/D box methylation guide ribonucleoprotein complex aNOP56 subunit [Thermocladium modestius]GGP19219.1 pre-mRNA processing ribonucleoprotein,-binding region [Thermocladium modestius]
MSMAYIVLDALGVAALDENGNVIDKELFEGDVDEIARKLTAMEQGQAIDEVIALISRLKGRGVSAVSLEHKEMARNVSLKETGVEVKAELPSKVGLMFRSQFKDKYVASLYGLSFEEYKDKLFEATVAQTRGKIRQTAEKRDLFIAQAISAVDDMDKILNLYASRMKEWYGLHFPELDGLTREQIEYAKLVFELGQRDNYTMDNILKAVPELQEDRAKKIAEAARRSVGASMTDWDIQQIKYIAKQFIDLYNARNEVTQYIDDAMKDVAPNIRELVGSLLGARLIMLAGGLMRLSMMPASTIQVLGAEKALFRALRTGSRPPKHGILFQFQEIFRAPRWQRGKIARALAAKLAIAAKADAFTGNFIAPKLKEDLMKRIQEIKTLYAKPPAKKPEQHQERHVGGGRSGGRRQWRGKR